MGKCGKKYVQITKRGSFFENVLSAVANLQSVNKTTKDYTNYVLQVILYLFKDTLKDAFFHLGGRLVSFLTIRISCLQ